MHVPLIELKNTIEYHERHAIIRRCEIRRISCYFSENLCKTYQSSIDLQTKKIISFRNNNEIIEI